MEAKGQIIDDTPIYYKDKEARALLGDETLETEAQTCTGGINELKQSFTDYDFAKETIRRVVISSSQQGIIQFMNSYFSFIVLGFAQGIGGIAIVGKASNGALTVNDLLTGSTWSNSALTFALDSAKTKLIVTSNQTAESRLTFICGNITS